MDQTSFSDIYWAQPRLCSSVIHNTLWKIGKTTAHLSRPKWVFHHGWRRRTMVSYSPDNSSVEEDYGPSPTCRTRPSGETERLSQRESKRTVNHCDLTPLWLCCNGHETDAKKRAGLVSVTFTRKRWHFINFN